MRKWIANGISFSRLLILLPWALVQGRGKAALPLIGFVIASDLLDGPVARRLGMASERGARIDAFCDLLFCLSASLVLAQGQVLYLPVFAAMVCAFGVWHGRHSRQGRVVYTRLGKYSGALCYGLIAFSSGRLWLGWIDEALLEWLEAGFASFVVLYLLASILENLGLFAAGGLRGPKRGTAPDGADEEAFPSPEAAKSGTGLASAR